MVADGGQRGLLHDLDQAIVSARGGLADNHPSAIALAGVYHNLIRMWSQV
jgi:PKHD-type hydroxylase